MRLTCDPLMVAIAATLMFPAAAGTAVMVKRPSEPVVEDLFPLVVTLAPLTGAAALCEDRLRAWRSETAKSDGVPAYVIFHDATLAEIARSEPGSLEDLRQIPGMGTRKLDRFGADLLEVVAAD